MTVTLSDQSVKVIVRLLEKDLGEAEDNLMRADMQKRSNPLWKSGKGETIDEVIAGYKAWADRTQKALQEMR